MCCWRSPERPRRFPAQYRNAGRGVRGRGPGARGGYDPAVPRYDLNGRVALITGGARGIGFGLAQAMVKRGAAVALVDLSADAAQQAASSLQGARAIGLGADVTDRMA